MSAIVLPLLPILQAARPDTVVMVPVRDAFDYIQAGTIVLVVVILFFVLMVLIRVLQTVERLSESIDPLVDRAAKGLDPVLERARSVSENVDYMSHAIRNDVEGLTEALDRIRGRLDQASDRMEERIEEFNALMELVQSEAEEIFLDTAATVRGVRAGSRSLACSEPSAPQGDVGSPEEHGKEHENERGKERGTTPRPGPAPAPGTMIQERPERSSGTERSAVGPGSGATRDAPTSDEGRESGRTRGDSTEEKPSV